MTDQKLSYTVSDYNAGGLKLVNVSCDGASGINLFDGGDSDSIDSKTLQRVGEYGLQVDGQKRDEGQQSKKVKLDRHSLTLKLESESAKGTLQKIDESNLEAAANNSKEWFGEEYTRDQLLSMYRPLVAKEKGRLRFKTFSSLNERLRIPFGFSEALNPQEGDTGKKSIELSVEGELEKQLRKLDEFVLDMAYNNQSTWFKKTNYTKEDLSVPDRHRKLVKRESEDYPSICKVKVLTSGYNKSSIFLVKETNEDSVFCEQLEPAFAERFVGKGDHCICVLELGNIYVKKSPIQFGISLHVVSMLVWKKNSSENAGSFTNMKLV